jgi:hypothetical protein
MIMKLLLWLAIIGSSLNCTSFASDTFPKQKFETWFSTYGHHFEKSSTTTCNHTLQQYKNRSSSSPFPWLEVAHHADCILANTTETIKFNMASAGIVLGLMPGILSTLGPNLAESPMLVFERPLLSLLLALSGPTFCPFPPFDHQDPRQALKQPLRSLSSIPSSRLALVLISLLQYVLAFAAAVNVVTTSLQLGLKTVLTWKKNQSYLPLIWVITPITIHLCATIRLQLFLKKVPNSVLVTIHQLLIPKSAGNKFKAK